MSPSPLSPREGLLSLLHLSHILTSISPHFHHYLSHLYKGRQLFHKPELGYFPTHKLSLWRKHSLSSSSPSACVLHHALVFQVILYYNGLACDLIQYCNIIVCNFRLCWDFLTSSNVVHSVLDPFAMRTATNHYYISIQEQLNLYLMTPP